MRRIERRIKSAYLDTKLLAASSEQIVKAGATLLITKTVFALLKTDAQIFIKRGKVTREAIDDLKNTVPTFTALRDMRADAPLREMNALLRDAKTVSERNKYPPYFFASAEIQMEASERVSRTILAEGIKEWGDAKSSLLRWK